MLLGTPNLGKTAIMSQIIAELDIGYDNTSTISLSSTCP